MANDNTAQVLNQNRSLIGTLVSDYRWIHVTLGIIGNTAFFVGSIFFLYSSMEVPAVWLFITGSFGMLIGSIGEAIVNFEEKRIKESRG
jgi:hypothetical protein